MNAYFRRNDMGLRRLFTKVIWNVETLLKIKVFFWLVINKVILIWNNMRKRSWQGDNIRPLIWHMKNQSTTFFWDAHLSVTFRGCWHNAWHCVSLTNPNVRSFFSLNFLLKGKDLSATIVFWEIWREKNNWIFNNLVRASDQTSMLALLFFLLAQSTFRQSQKHGDANYMQMQMTGTLDSQSEETRGRGDDYDTDDMWPMPFQTSDFCLSGWL